eukprot:COSAG05_NODE_22725_length_263_cov_0.335366_1_plen_62_part_01
MGCPAAGGVRRALAGSAGLRFVSLVSFGTPGAVETTAGPPTIGGVINDEQVHHDWPARSGRG